MSTNQNATQSANEFEIAASIANILDGYDKTMKKKVLNLLASRESCRLVPNGVPVGQITIGAKPKASTAQPQTRVSGKAPWKSDPRWVSIETEHSQLKASLKAIASGEDTSAALAALRECEARMKVLKHELRDSGSSGGASSSQ